MDVRRLAWVVLRDVNRTLGGGIASMELLRRSAAKERWLDEHGHAVLTAVSRLTPGTNVLAYCVGLGWQVSGWIGVVVSVLAASVPAAIMITALAATLVRIDRYPVVRVIIAVGVLAATALVASSAWYLMRPYLNRRSAWRAAIIAVVVAVLSWLDVTPVRIFLVSAVIGALIGVPANADVPAADA
ncbi:MAG TPA: chromate transporter [Vicinamibacterales bacterium]|jgi:chromate transporter